MEALVTFDGAVSDMVEQAKEGKAIALRFRSPIGVHIRLSIELPEGALGEPNAAVTQDMLRLFLEAACEMKRLLPYCASNADVTDA